MQGMAEIQRSIEGMKAAVLAESSKGGRPGSKTLTATSILYI